MRPDSFLALRATLPLALLAPLATMASAQDCWRPDALESATPSLVQEGAYDSLTLNVGGAGSVADHTDRYRIVMPPHSRLTLDLDLVSPVAPDTDGGPEFSGSFRVDGELPREFRVGGPAQHEHVYPPILENAGAASIDVEIEVGSNLTAEFGCLEYAMHLDLDRRPCDVLNEDALEGPDVCANGLVLAPGTYTDLVVFGAGRIDGEDADAYRIPNVAPGESVRVTVLPRDPANDRLFARLTDDSSCVDNAFLREVFLERNATSSIVDYSLHVSTDSAWDFAGYDLVVERLPDACGALSPDAFEPNDLCATAAVLGAGVQTNLTLDEAGDLFEVAVPADHTLIARVSTSDPDLQPWVAISGAASCPRNFASTEASVSVGGTPETLRVGVQALGIECGAYDLEIQLVPAPCTAAAGNGLHEPNDTCATAATVPLVVSADGSSAGEIRTSASDTDDDYYRVTVPAGSNLAVSLIGGLELTAYPAADCNAVPLVGTSAEFGSVATLLPATEAADVDYILGVSVPTGVVGCAPYVMLFSLTGSCGFFPLTEDGAPWEPQVSDCAAPLAVSAGLFEDVMLRPGATTVCAIDVQGGASLDVALDAAQLQFGVGAPVAVALHDGAADCAASGASLSSAVFSPGDPNPTLSWINHGQDRTVLVELGFAPGVSNCGALDVTFELGSGDPFTTACMPAPLTWVACPCGNDAVAASGGGCANSTGNSGRLAATGTAIVAADDFRPRVEGLSVEAPGVVLRRGQEFLEVAHPFHDGVLCIGAAPTTVARFVTGPGGTWQSTSLIAGSLGAAPGRLDRFQVWYRDRGGPCGTGSNTTNSIRVEWE